MFSECTVKEFPTLCERNELVKRFKVILLTFFIFAGGKFCENVGETFQLTYSFLIN